MDGLEEIINVVSTKYGIDITSSSRKGCIPMAKGVYCILAYRITPFTWVEITGKIGVNSAMMAHYQKNHQNLLGSDKKYTEMYNTLAESTRYIKTYYLDDDVQVQDKNPLEIQIELLEKTTKKFQNGKVNRNTYLKATRKIISGLKAIEYEACK